ncbi:hypothetical protein B1H58_12555 [Pantoea alhagi]|uniref:Uncharacterized protein n=1 Tax=Pantoea alhagi TaxID=1891675 RepID=A0A1W6B6S2_9GAMM|nr:protealysin inhibitor emfourin [Pantoea alhagi]ARJ42772.1 hypothetical protein B1H58_12555 [Pantoea alhagi]URQ59948.1 hypothetical protein LQ939_14510 [Pantoea alhagi]
MKELPELTDDAVIDLAREGGFAYIPKLAGQRRIALGQLANPQKERVCEILRHSLPLGEPADKQQQAGRGDQYYYRIQISYDTQHHSADIVIVIPDSLAPPELKALWKEGE